MHPSSLPLPHIWNFLVPLSAPERISRFRLRFRFQSLSSKCFRFRFHIPARNETANCILCKKKQASLLCKLFYLTCFVDRAWYGMENDFLLFRSGNFLPFHSILKIFLSIFLSILKFSSIFYSILPFQRNFRLEAIQLRIFCCFASLQRRCVNNTKIQQPVSGMHIAHGLMHRRSQDFGLGEG